METSVNERTWATLGWWNAPAESESTEEKEEEAGHTLLSVRVAGAHGSDNAARCVWHIKFYVCVYLLAIGEGYMWWISCVTNIICTSLLIPNGAFLRRAAIVRRHCHQ